MILFLLAFVAVSAARAEIRFEAQPPLPFVLENGAKGEFRLVELMLGGVGVLDYDQDGCLDLFFANGGALPSLAKTEAKFQNRLYKGDCRFGFTDVTGSAGVSGEGYSMGVAAADYDGDGRTDLFVAGVNRNLLYHNEGQGRFREVARQAGLSHGKGGQPWGVAAGWFDYNNDGHPDLFVVNYLAWNPATEPRCGTERARFYCHPNSFSPLPNQLFRNNGDGTFTDVSKSSGIADHHGKGMSVAFADFDRDGFTDAYVANDSMRGFLFRNQGDGTFAEVGIESGAALRDDGAPIAGMGVDFRDYNNDGLPDLVVTGMINDTFLLFRNLGRQWQFDDDRARMGLLLATRPFTGWGAGLFDFDNDGWKDLFFALSHFPRMDRYTGKDAELPCRIFRNVQGTRFEGAGLLGPPAFYRGAAFGDFDNDGRVDVVVTAVGAPARVFRNVSEAGNWLGVRTPGAGAEIEVVLPNGMKLWNQSTMSVGYASSSEAVVRFGLGQYDRASRVTVRFPGGKQQVLEGVAAKQIVEAPRP